MSDIPLTIDFETAYSAAYSLSKMTTAEYVLDPMFEIIGVAVKVGDAAAQWFSGSLAETKAWLQRFPFEQPGFVTVIQNSHFDGAIMEWILGIKPHRYFCTRMAARPILVPFTKSASLKNIVQYLGLGEKGTEVHSFIGRWRRNFTPEELAQYGSYCCNDAELTYQIYQYLEPQLPQREQQLIHFTTTKFTRPSIMLDPDVVRIRLAQVKQEKLEALHRAGLHTNEDLMSNPKFAEALLLMGVVPPTKISEATGKETWAFSKADPDFTDLLEHPNVSVQALVAARLKHKSTQEETRLERFQKQAMMNRPFAMPILYYGAHTGRFSGLDKLNLQNLPRGGELRRSLVAPPGYKLVAGDLSQVEARTTAYLAGQQDLLDRFEAGDDVYRWFASSLYNVPAAQITKEQRFVAKTCVLGMGYGVGATKFHTVMRNAQVPMTLEEAKRTVNTYRSTFARIPNLWRDLETGLSYMTDEKAHLKLPRIPIVFGYQCLTLPNGMQLLYPNLRKDDLNNTYVYDSHRGTRTLWGGALLENIVQALTRIILTDAELYLAERGYPAALSVHDELVYVLPDAKVATFETVLKKVLTRPVEWLPKLPLACEVASGSNYLECK